MNFSKNVSNETVTSNFLQVLQCRRNIYDQDSKNNKLINIKFSVLNCPFGLRPSPKYYKITTFRKLESASLFLTS
jgi:hypothetical protein